MGNLVSTDVYKPMQGWYARVYTAAALGLIVVLGIYRVYGNLEEASQTAKLGIPAAPAGGRRLAAVPHGPVSALR